MKSLLSFAFVCLSFGLFAQIEIEDKIEVKKDALRLSSVKDAFQLKSSSPFANLANEADQELHEAIVKRDINELLSFYKKLETLEDKTGEEPNVYGNMGLLQLAGNWIQKDDNMKDFDWTSLLGFSMDNKTTESVLSKMALAQSSAFNASAKKTRAKAPKTPLYELLVINQFREPIYIYHNGIYHSKVYAGKKERLRLDGGCQNFEIETRQGPVKERAICFTEGKTVNWTLN